MTPSLEIVMDDEGLDGYEKLSSPFFPPSSSSRHPLRTHPSRRQQIHSEWTSPKPSPPPQIPLRRQVDTTKKGRWTSQQVRQGEKKSGRPFMQTNLDLDFGRDSDVVPIGRGPCSPPPNPPLHRIILPGANSSANQEIKITKRQGERNEPVARFSSALNAR